jgi:hypothetical protein
MLKDYEITVRVRVRAASKDEAVAKVEVACESLISLCDDYFIDRAFTWRYDGAD